MGNIRQVKPPAHAIQLIHLDQHEIDIRLHTYIDKAGHSGIVQIVITIKEGMISAVIDFEDSKQYQNFTLPVWLIPYLNHLS